MQLKTSPKLWLFAIAFLVAAQVAASLLIPRGFTLTLVTDSLGSLLILSASAACIVNVTRTAGRTRVFWILQVAGWAISILAQVLWMFFDVVLRKEVPNPFVGDILLFLSEVPLLAALLMQPHLECSEQESPLGTMDFALLLLWWIYLYLFFVIPWQYIAPEEARYGLSYNRLAALLDGVILLVLISLWSRSTGRWKWFYAVFFGAHLLSSSSDYLINHAIDSHLYFPGSWYDFPYTATLASYTVLGLLGFGLRPGAATAPENPRSLLNVARLGMVAVLSLPVIAAWATLDRNTPPQVAEFRVLITLGTLLLMASLVFVKQHRLSAELATSNRALHEASVTDPLTGVRNRRFFDASIAGDVGRVLRAYTDGEDPRTRDLVFYLLDADNFKEVNDRYGHDVGDKVLVEMAWRVNSAIRNSDVLVRWGGEEFLIVSRYTSRTEAETLAARVLAAVGSTKIRIDDVITPIRLTCSIGWAAFPWIEERPEALPWDEVLMLADRAVYEAKQAGRNRAIGMLAAKSAITATPKTGDWVSTSSSRVQTLCLAEPS